jgi:hypothetical protein
VKPSDFDAHRISHQILGPCCLCPFIDVTGPDFVESTLCVVTLGPFTGEYAFMCARDRCGYFGELVGSGLKYMLIKSQCPRSACTPAERYAAKIIFFEVCI